MLIFSLCIAALLITIFFFSFWPLWQRATAQSRYIKTWLVLLFGVAVPVLGLYTMLGALPMVWLAP